MKKIKTVKIQIDEKTEKEFTVSELNVAEIIELSQNNPLFGATLNDDEKTAGNHTKNASDDGIKIEAKNWIDEIKSYKSSAIEVMTKSCDFKPKDLIPLAPSDIDKLFEDWKEVNQTFLSWLEKVGVLEAAKAIMDKAMSDFLETLAI